MSARAAPGALPKLLRTTAFRLSLAYLLIFTLVAVLALGYVAWNARRVVDDQIVSTIEAEINGLAEQYRAGGIRRLVAIVERRSSRPGASLYLVTTPAGERVVGNVQSLSPGVLDRSGQRETLYARTEDPEAEPSQALVRVYVLPGGFRLVVGRDVEEREQLRQVIGRSFASSLGLFLVLAFAGGLFVARRVL